MSVRHSRQFIACLVVLACALALRVTAQVRAEVPETEPVERIAVAPSQASVIPQHDPRALELLVALRQTFTARTGLVAQFTQRFYSRLRNQAVDTRGQLRFSAPHQVRLDYVAPQGDVYATDGVLGRIYNAASGTLLEFDPNGTPLALLARLLTDTPPADMTLRCVPGDSLSTVIELRSASTPLLDRMVVSVVTDSAHHRTYVDRLMLFDFEGNWVRLVLSDVRFARQSPAAFRLEYPSAETRRRQGFRSPLRVLYP